MLVKLVEDDVDAELHQWKMHLESGGHASPQFQLSSPFEAEKEKELVWYLERYADDPFAASRASRVSQSLANYGRALSRALEVHLLNLLSLISNNQSYETIRIGILGKGGLSRLHSIHWEVLEDLALWKTLSKHIQRLVVVRLVNPIPPISDFTKRHDPESLNVLVVSARPPEVPDDVPYRLVSRKIWELVHSSADLESHVKIHFARPGTFKNLEGVLEHHGKGFFDIVHFDTHGFVGKKDKVSRLGFACTRASGKLVQKSAAHIADLLRAWDVEHVILNACNSADTSNPPDSNLAQTFIMRGISTVLAMNYAVKIDTAALFVEAFYKELLINKSLSIAAAISRSVLRSRKQRAAAYATAIDLHDYFVPVLYQKHSEIRSYDNADGIELAFKADSDDQAGSQLGAVAVTGPPDDPPIGASVCRDADLLLLETSLGCSRPVLVTGAGGAGKTSLARHLQHWWKDTGYADEVVYISVSQEGPNFFNESIYTKVSSILWKEENLPKDLGSMQDIVHRSSLVLILDDLPGDGEHKSILTTNSSRINFYNFLSKFTNKENKCKLLIFSNDNLTTEALDDLDDYLYVHTLTDISDEEAGQIAKYYLNRESTRRDTPYNLSEKDAKDLMDLIQFHDSNPFFLKVFIPVLVREGKPPGQLLKDLQYEFPMACVERLDTCLGYSGHDHPSYVSELLEFLNTPQIVTAFQRLLLRYGQENTLAYTLLLNLAPFQRRVPQELETWLYRQVINGLLSEEETQDFSEIHVNESRFFDEEIWSVITGQHPQLPITQQEVLEDLESIGLVKTESDISNGLKYWRLHPILPYLLRHEIMRQQEVNGRDIMLALQHSLWQYYDNRAVKLVVDEGDPTRVGLKISVMLEKECHNIGNALAICQKDADFSLRPKFLCKMIRGLPIPRLSVLQQNYWNDVIDKFLARYILVKYEIPEADLSEFRSFSGIQTTFADVLWLAYVRGVILFYLHKYEAIKANTERALEIKDVLVGNEGVTPSLEASILCLRFQKASVDESSWRERQSEVEQLLAEPIPDGLTEADVQLVKAARSGLIMGLQRHFHRGLIPPSAIDLRSLVPEVQETMSQISSTPISRAIMPTSGRLGALTDSMTKLFLGGGEKGEEAETFGKMLREANVAIGKMPAFNAMTSWMKDFEYNSEGGSSEGGSFRGSTEDRRKIFHLKYVEAHSQTHLHQQYFYLMRLFDLALDDSDYISALARHEELSEIEDDTEMFDLLSQEKIIVNISYRLWNMADILMKDSSGSDAERENRLDEADNYLTLAADILDNNHNEKVGETLCRISALRGIIWSSRMEIDFSPESMQHALVQITMHMFRAARVEFLPEVSYAAEHVTAGGAVRLVLSAWAHSPLELAQELERRVGEEAGWPSGQVGSFFEQLVECFPSARYFGDAQAGAEGAEVEDAWMLVSDEAQQALLAPDAHQRAFNTLVKDDRGVWSLALKREDFE